MSVFFCLETISDFNDAEEKDDIDQTREEQCHDKGPMIGQDGALNEIPFAEETAGGRDPND